MYVGITSNSVNTSPWQWAQFDHVTSRVLGTKMEYVATAENGWNAVVIGNQVGWVSGNYSKVICASPVVSLHAVQPAFFFPWSVHGYT